MLMGTPSQAHIALWVEPMEFAKVSDLDVRDRSEKKTSEYDYLIKATAHSDLAKKRGDDAGLFRARWLLAVWWWVSAGTR